MGLNSRHNVINDKSTGYNITKSSSFRFELLPGVECRKIEVAQNMSMNQITLAIKVNGVINVDVSDKLKIFGKVYKVSTINNTIDNNELFKIRNDIENFTGDTVIGLT
jgi:hypothetical protein